MSGKRHTHLSIPIGFIPEPFLLTSIDAAKLLAVSPGTLHWWRTRGHRGGPDFIRLSQRGRVRYRLRDLRRFIEGRTVRIPKSFQERKRLIHAVLAEGERGGMR